MALTKIDDRGLKTPIDLIDNEKIRLGTGNDLEIYHDGSHSRIHDTGTGKLILAGSEINLNNAASSEYCLRTLEDGAVELYYNNVKHFETYEDGAKVHKYFVVSGLESGDSRIYMAADEGDDNADWWLMTAETGGQWTLKNLTSGSYETNIYANGNAAVELYYDNSKKLETTSSGITVTGNYATTGWIDIDSDSSKLRLGDGQDLEIYHDGESRVKNVGTVSSLYLQTHRGGLISEDASEWGVLFAENADVRLFYDGVEKFKTTSDGGTLSGALTVTNEINLFNGTTNASRYIDAGLGDDNSLVFRGCSGGDANHETLAQFQRNGAVELYHDNVKVIRTTSSGFNIGTHTGGQCLNQFNSGWSEFADDTDSGNIAVNTNVFLFVSAQKSAGPTTNYPTAIYHITYTGDITRLSQSADVFSENTDTDGRICVYKQANGQFRVKNRTGVNNKIGITVLHAQGV